MNKIICMNDGKDAAGCGYEICCQICNKMNDCDIACNKVIIIETGMKTENIECKYAKKVRMKMKDCCDIFLRYVEKFCMNKNKTIEEAQQEKLVIDVKEYYEDKYNGSQKEK